jgi:hypothetical protein
MDRKAMKRQRAIEPVRELGLFEGCGIPIELTRTQVTAKQIRQRISHKL